jgi:ferredoxin-NADP reductase
LVPSVFTLAVRDVRVETPRARVVRLSLGGNHFDFAAGQAVHLGLHRRPEQKPYSIACSPEQARQMDGLEFLVQVGEDGSAGTHLGVPAPGVLVDVEGPTGAFRFPANPPEPRFLFVAGGTGIAPLRAMLWHALAVFPDREVALVYSARSAADFAYGQEMRELARAGRLELLETVTRDPASAWTGTRGRITYARVASLMAVSPTLCLVCGPPALVADVTTWLRALGVPGDRILTEGWG